MIWNHDISPDVTNINILDRDYSLLFNGYNSLYECFLTSLNKYPEKTFIENNNIDYTYNDINNIVNNIINNLKNKNKKENLKVGILLDSSENYISLLLAINKLGWSAVLYPSKYSFYEINNLIECCEIDFLVSQDKFENIFSELNNITILKIDSLIDDNLLNHLENKHEQVHHYDINIKTLEKNAIFMFTSGTTAQSKACVIKNFNLVHALEAYRKIFKLSCDDSTVLSTPIYNITGIVGICFLMMSCGGKIHIHSKFNAENLVNTLIKEKVTYFHSSPTVLKKVIEQAKNIKFDTIKIVACGSSRLPEADIYKIKSIMPNSDIRIIYGLTESTSPGTILPFDAYNSNKKNSSGIPIPGFEVNIIDNNFKNIGSNIIGEVAIKGTNVITQYIPNNSDLINQDGLVRTGDIGYIDDDGFLFIKDRIKDIINKGGEKIFCLEVEECIYEINNVKEVAVVAKKNIEFGEIPVAIISTFNGFPIQEKEIINHLSKKLAKYKIPIEYYFVTELAKTKNNKIDKKKLREMFNENFL